MKNFRTIISKLYCLCIIYAATDLINPAKAQQLNQPAPAINFSTCLNDLHLKSDFYKGKTIVLDFWATWCGPCIASHPHLDTLSRQFSSDDVVFAMISCEDKNKVARFLKGKNIKAYYLVDAVTEESKTKANGGFAGVTYQAFNVTGIPYTIIIDKNGQLVWTGNTAGLTASILKGAITGQRLDITGRNRIAKSTQKTKDSIFTAAKKDTLRENGVIMVTAILPYTDYSMAAGINKAEQVRFVEAKGRPFGGYYENFTRTPQTRFVDQTGLGSIYARAEGDMAMAPNDFYATALDLLCKAYNIKLIKIQKLVDAYELKIVDSAKFNKEAKTLSELDDHGGNAETEKQLVYTNSSFESVGIGLEYFLNTPVIITDSSYLQKKCDITIEKGSFEQVNKYLMDTYGLQLNKVKREIEFTDILKAE